MFHTPVKKIVLGLGMSALTTLVLAAGSPGDSGPAAEKAQSEATPKMSPPLENWSAPQFFGESAGISASPSMGLTSSSAKTPTKVGLPLSTFIPLAPCRLVDTRGVFSPVYAGGAFAANEVRNYAIPSHCGVPAGINRMKAVSIAITTPPTSASGDIEVIATGATLGGTVAMVIQAGQWNSVSATPAVNSAGSIQVQLRTTPGDVVIDVNGYYAGTDDANTLDFFSVVGIYSSDGGLFYVQNDSTNGAAIRAVNSASGADVRLAQGANALDVADGGMRVRGAGAGSNTFVTKQVVNTAGAFSTGGGNLCTVGASNNAGTVIDNQYANGDPNAIIIITLNSFGAFGLSQGPYEVLYLYDATCGTAAVNHWSIFDLSAAPLPNNLTFNVMIIKP
jgi:hypothetical protein